jgi:hypothetical protein
MQRLEHSSKEERLREDRTAGVIEKQMKPSTETKLTGLGSKGDGFMDGREMFRLEKTESERKSSEEDKTQSKSCQIGQRHRMQGA